MLRQLRILVVGDVGPDDEPGNVELEEFLRLLAKEVITQGHCLLTMCRTDLDRALAESANEAVLATGGNPAERILSYHPRHKRGSHGFGTVHTSEVEDW